MNIDTSKWTAAVRNLQGLAKKRTQQQVAERAMKSLLRTAISITPPAQLKGQAFADRKIGPEHLALGELAIAIDVNRIFKVVRTGGDPVDMHSFHQAHRSKTTGRTFSLKRTPHKKARVTQSELEAYILKAQKKVGKLLAGWLEAAGQYKVPMPGWVKRHGGKHGGASTKVGVNHVNLKIWNSVPFVDRVGNMQRIMNNAMRIATGALQREYSAAIKRLCRSAGFKVGR